MQTAVKSHIGCVRKQNQDRFFLDESYGLFVICDGMGGHKAGEVAAQMAVDTIRSQLESADIEEPHRFLAAAIQLANSAIHDRSGQHEDLAEMGTTITALMLRDKTAYVAHIGDSSLFILGTDGPRKVTHDHTLSEKMIREGLLKGNEKAANRYSHILTRALGIESQVEIDLLAVEVDGDDRIFMATDGLTNLVQPQEVWTMVNNESDLDLALAKLTDLALQRGGQDNITMILVDLQ